MLSLVSGEEEIQGFPALAQQQIWQRFGQTQWLLFSTGCWTGPYNWETPFWSEVTFMTWVDRLLAHSSIMKSLKDTMIFCGCRHLQSVSVKYLTAWRCREPDLCAQLLHSVLEVKQMHLSEQPDLTYTSIMWVDWKTQLLKEPKFPTVWAIFKFPPQPSLAAVSSSGHFSSFLPIMTHFEKAKSSSTLPPPSSPQLPPGDSFEQHWMKGETAFSRMTPLF